MLISWIAFLLMGIICNLIKPYPFFNQYLDFISLIIIIFISILAILEITRSFKDSSRIVAFGYIFRVCLLFWDRYCSNIFSLPGSGGDTERFHRIAMNKTNGMNIYDSTKAYTNLLCLLYKIFGEQRIIAQFFNVLLSIASIYIVYKIFVMLKVDSKIINMGMAVMCFAPNLAITNSVLLRDTILIFLITISLYCFIIFWETHANIYFILSIVSCFYAATFHTGALAPVIGYIACALLYDKKNMRFVFKTSTIIGFAISVFVFMFLFENYGDVFFKKLQSTTLEDLVDISESGRGGSGYNIGVSTGSTLVDLIINSPIRVIYFILAPMPWDWRGLNDIIAFCFSSMLFFIGYIYVWKQCKSNYKNMIYNDLVVVCIILMLSFCMMFAWGVSNAGTALRHRDKFISVLVVMCVLSSRISKPENNLINICDEKMSESIFEERSHGFIPAD